MLSKHSPQPTLWHNNLKDTAKSVMATKNTAVNKGAKIIQHLLKDDGTFPNSMYPALVYKNAFLLVNDGSPAVIEDILKANNWFNSWRNGILSQHHYHSVTHEVLVAYKGACHLQLGGYDGIEFTIEAGDAIVIPAGVAHKNLGSSNDFKCIGAYPNGLDYDMNYGKAGERPATDHNIANVAMPEYDPIFGSDGTLLHYWVKHTA